MKYKYFILLTILTVFVLLLVAGCNKKGLAGKAINVDECYTECKVSFPDDRGAYGQCVEECLAKQEAASAEETSDGVGDGSASEGVVGEGSTEGSLCGNGVLDGSEQCDDGNMVNTDLCNNQCFSAKCEYLIPLNSSNSSSVPSNPFVKGGVSVFYNGELAWKPQQDSCPSNTDAKVWEVTCSNDDKVTTQTLLDCPEGASCKDGACTCTPGSTGVKKCYNNEWTSYYKEEVLKADCTTEFKPLQWCGNVKTPGVVLCEDSKGCKVTNYN